MCVSLLSEGLSVGFTTFSYLTTLSSALCCSLHQKEQKEKRDKTLSLILIYHWPIMAFKNATLVTLWLLVKNMCKSFSFLPVNPFDHLVSSCILVCFSVCAFPYILAFTTDSIEIRLVVNGNLVYTAVVPELQLVASRVSMMANTYSNTLAVICKCFWC